MARRRKVSRTTFSRRVYPHLRLSSHVSLGIWAKVMYMAWEGIGECVKQTTPPNPVSFALHTSGISTSDSLECTLENGSDTDVAISTVNSGCAGAACVWAWPWAGL